MRQKERRIMRLLKIPPLLARVLHAVGSCPGPRQWRPTISYTKHPPSTRRLVVTHAQLEQYRSPAPSSLTAAEVQERGRRVSRRMNLIRKLTQSYSCLLSDSTYFFTLFYPEEAITRYREPSHDRRAAAATAAERQVSGRAPTAQCPELLHRRFNQRRRGSSLHAAGHARDSRYAPAAVSTRRAIHQYAECFNMGGTVSTCTRVKTASGRSN